MAIAYVSRPSKMTIAVTTPPTTTSYMQGDTFDPTGMVVTGTRRDGSTVDVTASCTFSPSVLETSGTQTITISYGGKTTTTSVTVSEVSISITTPPTKTEYEKGDILDLTGIVVTAMDGQRTKNVTSQCTFSPANGDTLTTAGDVAITATYYGHTASTTISVVGLMGISITTPPTKTMYRDGDTLDLTGIVVTADYGSSTREVTSQCTFSPANGATLTSSSTTLTVTFLDQTTTMPITIIASTLDATSWATIQAIGAAGTGSQYWSLGDTKSIYISGQIGSATFSKTCQVFIVEFNYRGTKGIYFHGYIDPSTSKRFAFGNTVSPGYNAESTNGRLCFNMNHWGSNDYGGWKGCDLRYDILGSTDVAPSEYGKTHTTANVGYDATSTCATNPKSGTFMAALPSDLRAVIAPWTVYTTLGNKQNSCQSSVDYLPLPAHYELTGLQGRGFSSELSYVSQFSYYAQGGPVSGGTRWESAPFAEYVARKPFYQTNSFGSSDAKVWTRTGRAGYSNKFCMTESLSCLGETTLSYNETIAPVFRVA